MSRNSRKGNTVEGTAPPRNQSAPQTVGDTTAPDSERVAMRAYELYVARGGGEGSDMDDWLTAEREIGPRRASR